MRAAFTIMSARHAGDLDDPLQGVVLERLLEGLEVLAALLDEVLVVQAFVDDDPAHAHEQGDVRARLQPEPEVGVAHEVDFHAG